MERENFVHKNSVGLTHKGTVPLYGPRVVLERFCVEDALLMYKNWASDPEVTRYMTWFAHKDVQETESVISLWESDYSKLNFYQWAIVLRKIDEPIGSIGVVEHDEENQSCEIGYCIGKYFWHQGYTSEALEAVIKFLFDQVGYLKITARHDIRNPHSGDVMKKCGMRYIETRMNIGITKEGEPLNCAYYEIDKDTYMATRNN